MTPRRPPALGVRVSASYPEQHPDADPTATELVMNLLVTAALVEARLDRLLRQYHLTVGSFNVLQVVAGDPEPLTPSDIASRIAVPVTTATITGVLDTLARHTYIERRPHPTDRRRLLIHLTDTGRKALAAILPRLIEGEKHWTAGLAKSRRADLTDALGELQQHLKTSNQST